MATHRKILFIAPDSAAHRQWCEALRAAGFDPVVVEIGFALEETRIEPPHELVLLGSLAGGARADIVRRLRANEATQRLPILAVLPAEESEDPASVDALYDAGVDDFILSSSSGAELVGRARTLMGERPGYLGRVGDMRDARILLELTQALASSLEFREILYTVVRRVAEAIQVDRVSIVLAPEGEKESVGNVLVTSDDEGLTDLRIDLEKYPEVRTVLRTSEPLIVTDAKRHPLLHEVRDEVEQVELKALSLFPILLDEKAMGVLVLRSGPGRGALTVREAHFCQVVANTTAVALRNARVMQSLKDHTQQVTFAHFEAERRARSLERYAGLFASAAEGIAALGRDGQVLFANPRAYETIGYDEESFVNTKITTILHADEYRRAARLWKSLAQGDYPRGVDMRIVRKDGQIIVCSCSFAALPDEDGAVLVSLQDVTEQRRTEAELVKTMEFLESLIDASVDGIVASDMKGNIILFNQGAENIYAMRTEDVIGQRGAGSLYPGEGAKEVMRRLRSDEYGGVGRLEPTSFEAESSTGEIIPIQLSAAMIYEDGEPVATFGIFTDLRDKIRAESRLAEAQRKLELTEQQAMMTALAGSAAHELNQPLTSIIAYTELLLKRLDSSSPELKALQTIMEQSERMADIVKKIGRVTKYEVTSYVGRERIIDLDAAAAATEPEPPLDRKT